MHSLATLPQYIGMQSKQPWFVLRTARRFSILMSKDPSISHFYGFESDQGGSSILAIPDGCIDILFDCDVTNPSVSVHGTRMKACPTDLPKGHHYVGVRFSPGVLPSFLDIAANELINHNYNLLDIYPELERIFNQIVLEQDVIARLNMLKQFCTEKQIARQSSSLSQSVVNKICEVNGNIRVQDFESLTGYSTRTLQRIFKNDIGMSPKAFSRIIRCQSAVYKIHHHDVQFSSLASELGFSDQSHFLREFKLLTSISPLNYKKQLHQLSFANKIRYC